MKFCDDRQFLGLKFYLDVHWMRLCEKLYVSWQWNMASEEREWDGTSVG